MRVIHLIIFLAVGGKIAARRPHFLDGEPILNNKAPYFMSIRRSGEHVCSGALITHNLVFTSSSCLGDGAITLVSGVDENNPTGTVHQVHYIGFPVSPPVALITLAEPIPPDMTAYLPTDQPWYNQTAFFTSFQPENAQLRRFEVLMAPWRDCYPNEAMLCASRKRSGPIQTGERGGPLIHDEQLVGIATDLPSLNDGYDVYVDIYKIINTNRP